MKFSDHPARQNGAGRHHRYVVSGWTSGFDGAVHSVPYRTNCQFSHLVPLFTCTTRFEGASGISQKGPVVSGRWSVVSGQCSVVGGQLSVVSCQLSGVGRGLLVVGCRGRKRSQIETRKSKIPTPPCTRSPRLPMRERRGSFLIASVW